MNARVFWQPAILHSNQVYSIAEDQNPYQNAL